MSTKKPAIPDTIGVKDEATALILDAITENVEIITGRRGNIVKLGATATTSAIIQKINEIIDRLQL